MVSTIKTTLKTFLHRRLFKPLVELIHIRFSFLLSKLIRSRHISLVLKKWSHYIFKGRRPVLILMAVERGENRELTKVAEYMAEECSCCTSLEKTWAMSPDLKVAWLSRRNLCDWGDRSWWNLLKTLLGLGSARSTASFYSGLCSFATWFVPLLMSYLQQHLLSSPISFPALTLLH